MGDPKKNRKQYSSPRHPWNKEAILSERKISTDYGLLRKKELYKHSSFLKKYKDIAKQLIADTTQQGVKEKELMLSKLKKLGLISSAGGLDDVLSLELTDILNRRIQSVVFRKGLSKTIMQARQFINHGHITTGNRFITSPSYLVSLEEESSLGFKETSTLSSEDHPERISQEKEIAKEKKAIEQPTSEQESPKVETENKEISPDPIKEIKVQKVAEVLKNE